MTPAKAPVTEKYVYCPLCDYNLHGLPDGACPECGEPFERDKLMLSRVGRKETFMSLVATLIGWPMLVWLGVIPAIGFSLLPFVMLVFVVTGDEWVGVVGFQLVIAFILGVVLYYTVSICKDLARQTHRMMRAQAPADKDHLSKAGLFWRLLAFELCVILFTPVLLGLFVLLII